MPGCGLGTVTPSSGVAETLDVGLLAPPELTARSLKWYFVPLVSPVTLCEVRSELPLAVSVHAPNSASLSLRYWYS